MSRGRAFTPMATLPLILCLTGAAGVQAGAEEEPAPRRDLVSFGLMGGLAGAGRDPVAPWVGLEVQVQLRPNEHLALQVDAAYRRGTDENWVPAEVFEDRSLGATLVAVFGGPRTDGFAGAGLGVHFRDASDSHRTEKLTDAHVAAGATTRLGSRFRFLVGIRCDVLPGAEGNEKIDIITKVVIGVRFSP